jgi:hypothetical protein
MHMSRKSKKSSRALFQALESRTLFSASPLTIATATVYNGTQLQITGTTGSDNITIAQSPVGAQYPLGAIVVTDAGYASQTFAGNFASIKIVGNGGNDTITVGSTVKDNCLLYGGTGNDTITDNGSGADEMWGGGGTDTLHAGTGNDTLVSVGDTGATLVGGTGFDSFWMDNKTSEKATNVTAAETAGGNVHQITSFLEKGATLAATTMKIGSMNLTIYTPPTGTAAATDPTASGTYTSFASNPLFSVAGPSETDVKQGSLGDCYYVASLAATAASDPNRIRQSICDLGNGSYAIEFTNGNGVPTYVRVDADLPTTASGALTYGAGLGAQGSTWVALMEKAFAIVRTGADTYASIASGMPGEALADLGATQLTTLAPATAAQLLADINADLLLKGDAACYVMGGHCYAVSSVNLTAGTVTLYNPYGSYTTITGQQALQDMQGYASGVV